MSSQAHTPTRSSFPIVIAIIGLFLLFWFLTSKIYVGSTEASGAAAATDRPSLAEHRGKAMDTLQNAKVVDPTAGSVRLPIERAKELVIAENAR